MVLTSTQEMLRRGRETESRNKKEDADEEHKRGSENKTQRERNTQRCGRQAAYMACVCASRDVWVANEGTGDGWECCLSTVKTGCCGLRRAESLGGPRPFLLEYG